MEYKTNCLTCGKTLYRKKYLLKVNKVGFFCDSVCSNKGTKTTRDYPVLMGNCEWCKKPVYADNCLDIFRIKKYGRLFCNKTCMMYERNTWLWTDDRRKKVSKSNMGRNKGIKKSSSTCEKMSRANLGEKSHFWKGGKTNLSKRVRNSFKMINWKREVLKRDNFTCRMCSKRGGRLDADHIVPFSVLMDSVIKHDGDKYLYALSFGKLWELDNGRTLCRDCHKQTDTFANKHLLNSL